MADDDVPGIDDVPRLGRWLHENGITPTGVPPRVQLIAGGRSNLTYLLEPGEEAPRLVLRRPPLGHVLPTAHDMSREYRVLSALAGTDVPVPAPVALCPDADVIGAPFYLMGYVAGLVLRSAEDGARLTPESGAAAVRRASRTCSPRSTGWTWTPPGWPASGVPRATWNGSWPAGSGSGSCPPPGRCRVTRNSPSGSRRTCRAGPGPPPAGTLVHGDYRLDNMLVALAAGDSARPSIEAVLDWEMSTLGDPLADLGLALVYWTEPGDGDSLDVEWAPEVTTGPGFMTRAEIAGRYAAATGRDVSALGYYMAFGCFKLAVVLEGIHARFLQNKTVGEGFEREGPAVPSLIQRAHRLLDEGV